MGRKFYEDDELVIIKPGYNSPISPELKAQESTHGELSYVEGMVVRSTPFLEKQLNSTRLYLHDKLQIIQSELNTQISAVSNELSTINDKIQHNLKEPVLPNLIYILTFTLTGSIISSRRSLPIRFLTPSIFGITSFMYYMPKSYESTKQQLLSYESKNWPELHKQQSNILNQLKNLNNDFIRQTNELNKDLEKKIHDARLYLNDLIK